MAGDYYDTLGIARNASQDEIKRAYRRLARKYHPDVNREPGAEERFKEVNRAHEVLSDPEIRARYDRFGEVGVSGGAAGGGYGDPDIGGFADIFEQIFSGFGGMGGGPQARRRPSEPARGDDLRLDLKLNFREAIFGGEKEIRIPHLENCQTCQGSGAKPGTSAQVCGTCNGSGQVRRATRTPFGSFAQVSVCPTCQGDGQIIEEKCETCGGEGRRQETKKLKITIPRGVDSGTRLRVAREGDAGLRGGMSGDLYVYLFVEPDSEFQRNGVDILSEIEISYLQAILGCKLPIATVDGDIETTIPAGTQPNTVIRLEGHGVPRLNNPNSRGDHLLTVRIAIPTRISAEERELLIQLAQLKGESSGKEGGLESFLGKMFRG